MKFADLLLPVPLPGLFTYSVPASVRIEISAGKRVLVPFGKKKLITGIVRELHDRQPSGYEVKEIVSVLDSKPVVLEVQFRFWEWLAAYYMCTAGEVLKSAMAGGLRLEGAGGLANRPKTGTFITLHPSACNPRKLESLPATLKRAPRQLELLMSYLRLTGYAGNQKKAPEISKSLLLKESGSGSFPAKSLAEKEVLVEVTRQVSRLEQGDSAQKEISMLNRFQQEAIENIKEQFETKEVVLLNGITSGGKTEIYIHLIRDALEKGKQVLYLLPEIALTAQIINRLRNIFGNLAGVYHSRFSQPERGEIWDRVLSIGDDRYSLILGVRSSVFLPFRELGLVIVDEEHENTYKQTEPAPRYHARDSAIMLASMHGAKTLLGTATPSVESWYNSLSGKYGLVNLTKRYMEIELPEITIADTRLARKKKQMQSLFTPVLLDAIGEAIGTGQQVILFQNRRGYAPYIECMACGWVPVCRHCDVSMTYHKSLKRMVCHYCGESENLLPACSDCGSTDIKTRGFGTEKIEDEISIFFPSARVGRLDLDSVRKKRSHEKIIADFEAGKTDILAGTQMIAKGLDFGRVSLVGILNADNLLLFPDFRAHERSFQLLSQVSGRAGRKEKRGKVIIQTGFPDHPVIKNVIENNLDNHFRQQLAERKMFRYPPYVRLIRIVMKDRVYDTVSGAAQELGGRLKTIFGNRVLGPEAPVIARVQNRHIMHILLKIEKGADLARARSLVGREMGAVSSIKSYKSCHIFADVDPV
jgi:primosomal protein N' (replication factor Y) (superfamily II helicase)